MRVSRLTKIAGLTAATLALLAGSAVAQGVEENETERSVAESETELSKVSRQLVKIDQRINAVEKQAMLDSEPMEAEATYVEELKKAAIEKHPEVREKLERQEELISELKGDPELNMPPENRSEEFAEKLDEFKGLRDEINPVVQSVSSDPEVRESYQAFQETVVKKMKELEPQTEELLAQRAELADRFQELSGGAR
ncbi:hypothetical protein [Pelagicoccus sp. SDUM812002]|uniref:hypothetical protein n=1 Tax=Pelagicoccus sp. SDUM812002 TaxID=3041266 RepID=UPI00280D1EAF|nr:hypothetical protein [Pelagicoccus sp. SDUM812002]MDQ8184549.1 hypothetical protein [Pelagicoccus sp. SDUM812002]